MILPHPVNLERLIEEFAAAGIVAATGWGQNDALELHTYTAAGVPTEPPPACTPIIQAHDPNVPSTAQATTATNKTAVKDFQTAADTMLAQCDTYRTHADAMIAATQTATTVNQISAVVRDFLQDWRSFLGDHKKFIRGVDASFDLLVPPEPPA